MTEDESENEARPDCGALSPKSRRDCLYYRWHKGFKVKNDVTQDDIMRYAFEL